MSCSIEADRFLFRQELFGGMIIARDSGHELLLNHSAFFIARLYLEDGLTKTAIQDKILNQFKPSSATDLPAQIEGVIADVEQYFLSSSQQAIWNSTYAPIEDLEVLSAPISVFWEITSRCNQACLHCYNESGQKAKGELDSQECLELIDDLHQMGTYKLIIGGGEPFCRADFTGLVRHACGLGMSVVVATNGTLLDDEACELAARFAGLRYLVSLHDFDSRRHNRFCGRPGVYEKTLKGLARLKKHGIPFGIQSMLTPPLCTDLDGFVGFIHDLGAQSLHLKSAVAIGKECQNQSCLGDNELIAYGSKIERLASQYAPNLQIHFGIPMADTFGKNQVRQEPLQMKLACGPGFRNCGILPDGRLVACSFLRGKGWTSEWSVREKPFSQLWKDSAIFQPFRSLTSLDIKSCRSCSRLGKECHAGCRARAYNETGNFYGRDPRCMLQDLEKESLLR